MLVPTPTLQSNLESRLTPAIADHIQKLHSGEFYRDYKGGPEQLKQAAAAAYAKDIAKIIAEEVDTWLNAVTFIIQPGLASAGSGAGPTGPIVVEVTSVSPYPNITKV